MKLDRLTAALVKAYEFPQIIIDEEKARATDQEIFSSLIYTYCFVAYLESKGIIQAPMNISDIQTHEFYVDHIFPHGDCVEEFYAEAFLRLYEDSQTKGFH